METQKLQLTPELRQAVLANPGQAVCFQDDQTEKFYLLIEQEVAPTLGEEYIRRGLEVARQQIARNDVLETTENEIIAEAKRRQALES